MGAQIPCLCLAPASWLSLTPQPVERLLSRWDPLLVPDGCTGRFVRGRLLCCPLLSSLGFALLCHCGAGLRVAQRGKPVVKAISRLPHSTGEASLKALDPRKGMPMCTRPGSGKKGNIPPPRPLSSSPNSAASSPREPGEQPLFEKLLEDRRYTAGFRV